MPNRCKSPVPTKRVASPLGQPLAYCPNCMSWKPAAQVPFGSERRDSTGRIVASYAPKPH